ncbi:hypothetical protein LIER_36733 [Lithospermum erythrorhizon]|uniref:Reverse transcriptase zinc-binding domain-containing protein n=1 Tax=Lithospermum erythrorhizon TaxID=34254 RepID=A0AAV3PB68_LITER
MIGDLVELKEKVDAVVIVADKEDRVQWRDAVGNKPRDISKLLKNPGEKVKWAKFLWHSFDISRHNFIIYFLVRGRLEIRDRVSKWLPNCERSYLFCEKEETQEHLFFDCVYSGKVWRQVLDMLRLYKGNGWWRMEFSWMINVKTRSKL